MDRFSELKAFSVVASTGGFSAAARNLGMAPSSVVRLIDALEARIGTKLVNRSTRTVTLTDSGRLYFDNVVSLLEQIEEAENSTSHQGVPQGRLKISAPVTFGTTYLAPALFELQSTYPKLSVHLHLSDGISDLAEESIDIAIRIGDPRHYANLTARRLAGHRRILCASPAYFAAAGELIRPDQLQQHDCLMFAYGAQQQQWRFVHKDDPMADPEVVDVKGSLTVNNSALLRQACLSGQGIALLPDWLVMRDVEQGSLVWALQNYEANPGAMEVGIYAMYQPNRDEAMKVQAFISVLKKVLDGALPTMQ
ncbi:LysR family transcriptional regulator [Herbaspirillum huttiense]|uniref:LysR family transcriptional regulator n=1 Tax=Herbaspirillum huttiense TaxID=863372 RepID=UPI0039AFD2AF